MTRTGNVLLSKKIFDENGFLFAVKKGRTGGEDQEFFKLLIKHGYSFIWCQEADVYEVVYRDRWKLSHYLYHNLMKGGIDGAEVGKYGAKYFVRSLISFLCYLSLFIATMFNSKHILFKYFIRVVYDFGRVMGCFGLVIIKERRD